MRKTVPIDKLLVWAYTEELPKRDLAAKEGGTWGFFHRFAELGTAVDEWSYQRYASIGDVHPDAEALEKAVSQLEDIAIDWETEKLGLMGAWAWMLEGEYADKAIRGCSKIVHLAGLVTSCAARGKVPYWHDAPPSCEGYRIEGKAGRPTWVVLGGKQIERGGKRTWTYGSYCPLKWLPSGTEIGLDRAEYLGWWRGLGILRERISGRLREFEPGPPEAPERPWVDPPRVVQNIPRGIATTTRLPLGPQREWPARQAAAGRNSNVRVVGTTA